MTLLGRCDPDTNQFNLLSNNYLNKEKLCPVIN